MTGKPNDSAFEKGGLQIHWKNGIRSWFDVDGITIEVWASSWSGREEVRIDGRVVSRRRSLRRSGTHEFRHGGHDYRVRVSCLSFKTGFFQVTLYRDGVEIDSDTGSAMGRELLDEQGRIVWSRAWKKLLPTFVLSGVLGAAFGYTLASLVK